MINIHNINVGIVLVNVCVLYVEIDIKIIYKKKYTILLHYYLSVALEFCLCCMVRMCCSSFTRHKRRFRHEDS